MSDAVKILAVDDDEMNLEMISFMLSEIDCQIVRAVDGRQALEALAAHPDTDVILLDLEMPVLDGYQTLDRLKQSPAWRDIPVLVVTSCRHDVTRTLALGANDFLSKPYDPVELRLRVMNHMRSKKLADLARDVNRVLEREVQKKTAQLQEALVLSRGAEYEISLRLGKAAEFRDRATGLHTRRISELSRMLGQLAGLSEERCEELHKASALHDVGKIGIADRILLKPGELEAEEFEAIKQHTVIGGHILADTGRYPLLQAGAIIALQHHEKWDGSGYPSGLKGDEIHRYARMVAIVDVFDALTSERPYKKPFPLETTLRIMAKGRGEAFDPELFDIFFAHIDRFVAVREALTDPAETEGPLEVTCSGTR